MSLVSDGWIVVEYRDGGKSRIVANVDGAAGLSIAFERHQPWDGWVLDNESERYLTKETLRLLGKLLRPGECYDCDRMDCDCGRFEREG